MQILVCQTIADNTGRSKYRHLPRWVVLIGIAAMMVLHGFAQQANTAGVLGSVVDAQGAVVPGATVTMTHQETQQTRTDVTDSRGEFRIQLLAVGHYTLSVTKAGFETFSQTGILLQVNDNLKLQPRLGVGHVAVSVNVNSSTPLVQTQDAQVQSVIDSERVDNLPLNGRNLADLALLSAGVNIAQNTHGANQQGYGDGIKITEGSRQFSINGARNNETRYTLDGADNNDTMYNSGMPFPFPDAVQEFSVVTAGKGADVGSSPGGAINIITRSGTNRIHGDAFWFVRNTVFDADNFFSTTGDELKRNQAGFTIGGPVLKNKLFLFVGWQRTWNRQLEGANLVQAMPAAYRHGDFSNLLTTSDTSQRVQLVDPNTGANYTNNQIPSSEFSPAMQKLLNYWPIPDEDGLVSAPVYNNNDIIQYVGRADYTLNSHHTFYARYLRQSYSYPVPLLNDNLATSEDGAKTVSHSGTLGWTWILNDRLIASSHIYLNYVPAHRTLSAPWGNIKEALGIDINPGSTEMDVSLSGSSGFGLGSAGRGADFKRGEGGFSQSWQWTKGKNNFSFGGEMMWSRYNEYNAYHASGVFEFNGQCSGFDQADAMLGCLGGFTQGIGEFEFRREHYQALFAGDSIRLTPRLTVNAGLRWEPYTPITDTGNRNVLFLPQEYASGTHSQVYVNSPAGMFYPGDAVNGKKIHNGVTDAMWNLVGPRVGFGWDVLGNGKLSVRGGAGIYYSHPEAYMLNALSDQAPFGYDENYTSGNFDAPWTGRESANVFPIPNGFLQNPNLTFPEPYEAYAQVPHWKIPTTYAWNLVVEEEFAPGWAFHLAYIGNHSSQLAYSQDINAPAYDYSLTEQQNLQDIQSRRPMPEFEELYLLQAGQNADYNGLQAAIQHDMKHGFSFTANYTYAKALDYSSQNGSVEDMNGGSSTPDPFNPFRFRGPSDYDRRNVFVASLLYELPGVVADKNLLSLLTNHWRLGGIVTSQTGFPMTITADEEQAGCGPGCLPHAQQTGPLAWGHNRSRAEMVSEYFNTSNVTAGAPGSFGNIGRNSLYGPGYENIDASMSKTFPLPITESTRAEFRAEAFNLLNHPNFEDPDSSYGSSTFGRITATQGDPRILQFAVKVSF